MKKILKLSKRLLAFTISVLFSVNTYAAVSSNDGSAFITKAEFDALVNTFNEQMDNYEASIVSKVDGAIANYLAGLSNVITEKREPLVKPGYGVWSASVESDKKNWTEGTMSASFRIYMGRVLQNSNVTGGYILNMNASDAIPFKEHIIYPYRDANSTWVGEYIGYCKTKQYCVGYGGDIQASEFKYTTTAYINNFYWNWGSEPKGHFNSDPSASGSYNNVNIQGGSCSRTVDETLFNCVICTPVNGISFPYFNIYDTSGASAQWCYDPNMDSNGLHSKITKPINCFASWSGNMYTPNGASGTFLNGTLRNGWDGSNTGTSFIRGSDCISKCKPFLGFHKEVVDWKNIYMTAYDNYVDELVSKSAAGITTVNNKKHLLSYNGFPLIYAKKGEVVHLPVKFDKIDGEWKNIDIWLKASAFKLDEDVLTTTSEDLITATNEANMKKSSYSTAIQLDATEGNGEGILKFTMPKDGYVFMKWSLAGNGAKGGGTFHPQTILVELNND